MMVNIMKMQACPGVWCLVRSNKNDCVFSPALVGNNSTGNYGSYCKEIFLLFIPSFLFSFLTYISALPEVLNY